MEDQAQERNKSNQATEGERSEPVRSRWTPKPEQILILESIFNSGMVNPPKDETVRIRKLLEKFGSVGDANVFYWFQNRRSRSRRRQRQIQASLSGEQSQPTRSGGGAGALHYEASSSTSFSPAAVAGCPFSTTTSLVGSSSTSGMVQNDCSNDLYTFQAPICHPEFDHNSSAPSVFCPSQINDSHYHSGFITVFINGVATDVPRGPIDMRALCGQDFVLFHSSGVPIAVNEYGFFLESLQHGESYFLDSCKADTITRFRNCVDRDLNKIIYRTSLVSPCIYRKTYWQQYPRPLPSPPI